MGGKLIVAAMASGRWRQSKFTDAERSSRGRLRGRTDFATGQRAERSVAPARDREAVLRWLFRLRHSAASGA
jgi:hypothetical protein